MILERNSPEYFHLLENGRTRSETLVKTIALQVACTCAFGHLLSLQRRSSSTQVARVCACLVTPGLPLALLFKAAIDAVALAQRRRRSRTAEQTAQLSYLHWAAAVLGVQALPLNDDNDESKGVRLLSTRPATRVFERTSEPYNWRLLGRIIVLLAFTAQAGIALCQWVRRIVFSYQNTFVSADDGQPYGQYCDSTSYGFANAADTPLDHLNALAVLGGITASSTSICLSLMNSKWTYHDVPDAEGVMTTGEYNLPLPALMRLSFFFDVLVLSRMITHYLLPNALRVLQFDIWYMYREPSIMTIIVLCSLGWLCLIIIPLRGLCWALAPLRPAFFAWGIARASGWFEDFKAPIFRSPLSLSGFRVRFHTISWPELRPMPSWPDVLGPMGVVIALWRAMLIWLAFSLLYGDMRHRIYVEEGVQKCFGFDCCYPFFLWKDQTLDKLWTF